MSRNVRFFTAALKADGSFDKVTGEYVYVPDTPETFLLDASTKQNDVKVSEMSVTPDGKLIVLERISKVTKLYQVDWSKATNILGTQWDERATQPSLEQRADLVAAGIGAVGKAPVFNTETDERAATSPGKVEGLAFLNAGSFVLLTDNDFGIVSPQTFFYVVALTPRSNGEKRWLWGQKRRNPGFSADDHPQHSEPEPRVARGSRPRKRARRLSEPFRLVANGRRFNSVSVA